MDRLIINPLPATDPLSRLEALNDTVDLVVKALDATPFTWEERVSISLLAAAKVLAKDAPLKGRRGEWIKAVTEDFRRKLQAALPF